MIFSISIVTKAFQNDTFFTIVIGDRVLEYGIEKEEKLVWHEGLEYTNSRWLFDICISKIYQICGWNGIYGFVMFVTAIQGILLYYILNKFTKNKYIAFISSLVIMNLLKVEFAARSQIISFLIFLIEFYFIEKMLETNKNRYIFGLAILAILLVNIHASVFPMYFVFYLPYLAEYIIKKLKLKDGNKFIIEKRKIIKLIISMCIGFGLGFCTPDGMSPYTDMFKAMGGISTEFIEELKPLTIVSGWQIFAIISIVIAIIAFTKTKVRITDCFFIIGFAIMGLYTYRCQFFFYLISGCCVVRIISDFFKEYNLNLDFLSNRYKAIIFVVTSIIVILISSNKLFDNLKNDYIDSMYYPIGATEYILNNINVDEMKIYNHFNFGSYLEFKGIKAFIDSRSGVFTEEFNPGTTILSDWYDTYKGNEHYKKTFDKYEITHVLVYIEEVINVYMQNDPEWKLIYQDDQFYLYEKVK